MSSNSSRPASAMQNVEDEICLAPDSSEQSGKRASNLLSERIPDAPIRTSKIEVRPSRFGTVALGQANKQEMLRRQKKKNAVKGICRRMILAIAACFHFFGRWIDYFIAKGVVFLTYISGLVYNSTKGIGKALGFSLGSF